MSKIEKIGNRNRIIPTGRRYTLSQLISESYQTLYECDLDSKLYRLTESHIRSVRNHPEEVEDHSKSLDILKQLLRLGDSAIIRESDIPDLDSENEEFLEEPLEGDEEEEPLEEEDEEDPLEEEEPLEEEDEEDPLEEEEPLEEEDEEEDEEDPLEEEDSEEEITDEEIDSLDEEDEEITPEELEELKRHLRELRRARECFNPKPSKPVTETRSWSSERASMTKALKNFRESSNKKAFYKSFSKLHKRMKSKDPLTLEESILLYKASNSTMTHLAVELEHNPEFIYTFRECTELLSKDNEKLLECIRKQVVPSKSLLESYRNFSNILLESEGAEEENPEDEEDSLLDSEDAEVIPPESEEETPVEESEEEDVIPSEGDEEEEPLEEEDEEEDEEDPLEEEDSEEEITDEEAEELKKKLEELRKSRKG